MQSNTTFTVRNSLLASRLLSVGYFFAVGLTTKGTLLASNYFGDPDDDKGQTSVLQWKNVGQIETRDLHTHALLENGTVVAKGSNYFGQLNVQQWNNILEIAAGEHHIVGLKADGTVIAAGLNEEGQCNVSSWKNIIAISAGFGHTLGLRKDGTVVSTRYIGDSDDYKGQCDVEDWRDITAIAAGCWHSVGLKKDGTVVTTGFNRDGQCNTQYWRDIVNIAAAGAHTVGVKTNGTVVYAGLDKYNSCNFKGYDWNDPKLPVVAVRTSDYQTFGIRSDGTVVCTPDSNVQHGVCNIKGWKLFDDYNNLESEINSRLYGLQKKIDDLEKKKSEVKGLFANSKKKRIDEDIVKQRTALEMMKQQMFHHVNQI